MGNYKYQILISIIFLIGLIITGVRLRGKYGTKIDIAVRDYFLGHNLVPLKWVMRKITKLANVETIFIISLPMFFYLLRQKDFIASSAMMMGTGSAIFICQAMKFSFKRSRPRIENRNINFIGYSFPSGHSSVGVGFYVTISYVLTYGYNIFILAMTASIILSILICLSRIVLGVHWFSDVFAGFLLGSICAYWGIFLFRNGIWFEFLFSNSLFR